MLCRNSLGIAELKEALLCEGDGVTDSTGCISSCHWGEKTSCCGVAPASSGLLSLGLWSGADTTGQCICSLPSNSSHRVLGKTVLRAGISCSLATPNSGENLEVRGRFGNLMDFNLILMFNRAAVSLCLFKFALLVELEWHCCTYGWTRPVRSLDLMPPSELQGRICYHIGSWVDYL